MALKVKQLNYLVFSVCYLKIPILLFAFFPLFCFGQGLSVSFPYNNVYACSDSSYTISWTGGTPTDLISISLIDVQNWAVEYSIATNLPNTGSYSTSFHIGGFGPGTKRIYIQTTTQSSWSYGLIFNLYQCCNNTTTITPQGPTTFCQGDSVVLAATQGASYLWSNGQTTQSITESNAGVYSVQVTYPNGCIGTSTATQVTVNQNPDVTVSHIGPTVFCSGNSLSLSVTGADTYWWSTNQMGNSISIGVSGNVFAVGTDANGCTDTSNVISVVVNPNPQVSIMNNGPTTLCSGSHVNLNASGANTYFWSHNATGNSVLIHTSGSYFAVGTDANGCTDTSNVISVVVNPNPQVSIMNNGPTTLCSGSHVNLNASGAITYFWSHNATGNSVLIHTSGSYFAVGTDANGCIDTSNVISVVVNPNPQVSITNNGPTTVCLGDSLTLIASGVANNFVWSNGQQTPFINVHSSGVYFVVGTDHNGCIDTSSAISVLVNPNPTVTLAHSTPIVFCQGGAVSLFASGAISYQWSNMQTTDSITVNSSGIYYAVGTDNNGCSDTSNTLLITVHSNPQVLISNNGPTSFCPGGSVNLYSTGADSYTWNTNQTGNLLNVNATGNYYVVGIDGNGCSDTSNAISVLVFPNPVVSISQFGAATFCSGGNVTLIASGVASNYVWSNSQTGPFITVASTGNYFVIGTDGNGCSDTSNIFSVVVFPNPNAVISAPNTSFCQGDSIVLTGVQGLNNVWSTAQTDDSIWVSQGGIYQLMVIDTNGCQDSTTLQVLTHPLPQFSITVLGNQTFCEKDSTALLGSGSMTFNWTTGDTTHMIYVSSSGNYAFSGIDSNGCTSTSNPMVITVLDYPIIISQPQDRYEQLGNNAVFSVLSQHSLDTYQWESDLGLGFQTIQNNGQYSGSSGSQLSINNLVSNNHGQLFRCIISNDICSVYSDTAILYIAPVSGYSNVQTRFTLSPNPAREFVILEFQEPVETTYILLNVNGQELSRGSIKGRNVTLPVYMLPVGVYFIRVEESLIRFVRHE